MQNTNTGTELMEIEPSDVLPPEVEAFYSKPVISDVELAYCADKLTQLYKHRVDYLLKEYPCYSTEENLRRAEYEVSQENALRTLNTPAEDLTWSGIETIFNYNPALFLRKWEETKQDAARELQSGLIAYKACSPEDTPYAKAQFLALRDELAEEWNPRNGIERNLIDQMAQAYTCVLYWQQIMFRWQNLDTPRRAKKTMGYGEPEEPPRLSTFEAVNRAADMIDKFQRMFLRTLRALQNMRKLAPVIVQNAGQVNLGQQQVNVSQPAGG